jgi:hypothetical protein
MGMSGYSQTPLAAKLGIKRGMTVAILDAPDDFELCGLPEGVTKRDTAAPADIYLIFVTAAAEAEPLFVRAMTTLPPDGAIWMAWPKKTSGLDTDISENTLRDLFLPTGLVDNKVCAIDDIWSGLRFVVRRENRGEWPLSTA